MTSEEALGYFRSAVANERLAQGYILAGPLLQSGAPLARRIIQLLYCSETPKGCGRCTACRHVEERVHPDLLWLEPQKRSRAISIEQIRQLDARFSMTSYSGGWKSAVLVSAERMTDEAANAFLKTLEEPAGRSLFLLVTESPGAFLPTIVSRCQTVSIQDPEGAGEEVDDKWVTALLDILGRPEMTESGTAWPVLSGFAAADLVQGLLTLIKKASEKEAADAAGEDVDDETLDARASAIYRGHRTRIMKALLEWHQDVLLAVSGADDALLHNAQRGAEIRRAAQGTSYARALHNVKAVETMHQQMERNLPEGIALGSGFVRMMSADDGGKAAHAQNRRSTG